MANWVAGLAAFRSDDFTRAAGHFARVATAAHSKDLAAAGEFWAARADTACGRPDRVTARLRAAARYDDAFYGLFDRRSEARRVGKECVSTCRFRGAAYH